MRGISNTRTCPRDLFEIADAYMTFAGGRIASICDPKLPFEAVRAADVFL